MNLPQQDPGPGSPLHVRRDPEGRTVLGDGGGDGLHVPNLHRPEQGQGRAFAEPADIGVLLPVPVEKDLRGPGLHQEPQPVLSGPESGGHVQLQGLEGVGFRDADAVEPDAAAGVQGGNGQPGVGEVLRFKLFGEDQAAVPVFVVPHRVGEGDLSQLPAVRLIGGGGAEEIGDGAAFQDHFLRPEPPLPGVEHPAAEEQQVRGEPGGHGQRAAFLTV